MPSGNYGTGGQPFSPPPFSQQNAPAQNVSQNQYQNRQDEKPIEYVEQDPGVNKEVHRPQEWLKPKTFGGKNTRG